MKGLEGKEKCQSKGQGLENLGAGSGEQRAGPGELGSRVWRAGPREFRSRFGELGSRVWRT